MFKLNGKDREAVFLFTYPTIKHINPLMTLSAIRMFLGSSSNNSLDVLDVKQVLKYKLTEIC